MAQVGWVRWSGRVCGYVGTGTSRASEYTCRGAMDGSVLTERVSEPGHPTLPTPPPPAAATRYHYPTRTAYRSAPGHCQAAHTHARPALIAR